MRTTILGASLAVAVIAGAAAQSDSPAVKASPDNPIFAKKAAPASDSHGQLAGSAVPGGTNKAPATGKPSNSFSHPVHKTN